MLIRPTLLMQLRWLKSLILGEREVHNLPCWPLHSINSEDQNERILSTSWCVDSFHCQLLKTVFRIARMAS